MGRLSRLPGPGSFPLLEDVIVLTDAAMKGGKPARIVPQLVENLQGLLGNVGELPARLMQTGARDYVRRELYRSPAFGYRVLAITWGAGQASPIHDHADTWGIEAVLCGELEVTDFRSLRQYEALSELVPRGQHRLGTARSSACCRRTTCTPAATWPPGARRSRCTSMAATSTRCGATSTSRDGCTARTGCG